MPPEQRFPHLKQAFGGLQLPRHGLSQWFEDVQSFCREHGGEKHYAELMELIDACQAQLAKEEGLAKGVDDE